MTPASRTPPIKSQVVFAPAGAGKTERLSTRYIELLESDVPPERILTLTFTEKAAAEMKERIFLRLEQRRPDLYRQLRDNLFRVRISTIHSFCLSLLKRFAPLLGLDPRLDVLTTPDELWASTKYDTLMQLAEGDSLARRELLELVTSDQIQGWTSLSSLFDQLFARRTAVLRGRFIEPDFERLSRLAADLRSDPVGYERLPEYELLFPDTLHRQSIRSADNSSPPELPALIEVRRLLRKHAHSFLNKSGKPLKRGCDARTQAWNERLYEYGMLVDAVISQSEFRRSFELFRDSFLATYTRAKHELGQVDYDDMELLALNLLLQNPEWQNILYAFDEHTDHLLVDEFQDTSFIQWGIIDKLTEEWRSGEGIKSARGIEPSVFIVGDDKQSIYMFRDANVEVFTRVSDQLERWLGPNRFELLQLEDNYRSLTAIVDFNNALFSGMMSGNSATDKTGSQPEPWQTRYRPFRLARLNSAPGIVEVILDEHDASVGERRRRDATNVCRRILSLLTPDSGFRVFDRSTDGEIARPCRFEDIAILIRQRTHLAEIEFALRAHAIPFVVLGGTGFYAEAEIRYLRALLAFLVDQSDDVALYQTLRGPLFRVPERELLIAASSEGIFLWDRLKENAGQNTTLRSAVSRLEGWLGRLYQDSLSNIIEQALVETGAWRAFWEPQREANVRKFLRILDDRESAGEHPLRILAALSPKTAQEEKADIPVAGRDAVCVVTVHSAKGLEFPVVFVPGLDDIIKPFGSSGPSLVVEETGPSEVIISYLDTPEARRHDPFHVRHVSKELEEEKRVFYVACTRARDALFLTGIWNEKSLKKTRLQWLIDHLGLTRTGDSFEFRRAPNGTRVVRASDIAAAPTPAVVPSEQPRRFVSPAPLQASTPAIRSVSRYAPAELRIASSSAHFAIGDIIHSVLESISTSAISPDPESLENETRRLLRLQALPGDRQEAAVRAIMEQLAGLKNSPAWDVILPQPNSFAELPVIFNLDGNWHSGRIDRVVVSEHDVRIYDYKTFPVAPNDLSGLTREFYDYQLRFYAAACRDLFPGREVSTWLIFTALPAIVRCP